MRSRTPRPAARRGGARGARQGARTIEGDPSLARSMLCSAHHGRTPELEASRAPRRGAPPSSPPRSGSLDLEHDPHGVVDLAPFDVADGSPISGHVPFDGGTG